MIQLRHRTERDRLRRRCSVLPPALERMRAISSSGLVLMLLVCRLTITTTEAFSWTVPTAPTNAPQRTSTKQYSDISSSRGYTKTQLSLAKVSSIDQDERLEKKKRPKAIEETEEPLFSSSEHDTSNARMPPTNDQDGMSKWNQDDLETYQTNLQLASLAESCATNRNVTAAKMALHLFRSMERPDSVAFNSVLKALAKISPAVLSSPPQAATTVTASEAAEMLLRQMQSLHQRQVAANEAWYQQLSDGTLPDAELDQGPPRVRVKPNVRSVSTVMDALGRTGKLEAARRAHELLDTLQQEYEATGDGALQPNIITYNTLLTAYANCGEYQQCLQIVQDMPVTADIISHNAVLHAMAQCRERPDMAGQRAEDYLRQITSVQPNARSYSTCMDAWSRSKQPERAHRLLQEIMQAYRSSGRNPALRPNAITYSTVIHGYAVCKDSQKAVRAFQVWQDMQKEGIKPNQVTVNNVLLACATTRPPTPIVRRMVQTLYKHSLRHGKPDEVTFGIVLRACENWMEQSALSPEDVFQEACRRGVVSQGVLHHLRQAVPRDTFRNLVGDHGNYDDLPAEWRKRVKPLPRRRR